LSNPTGQPREPPVESGYRYDFNVLEERANTLIDLGRLTDSIRIYLFMADGDNSLDGGYLGERIGQCYERLGDLHAAKYWFGRAVEENPRIPAYTAARQRVNFATIDDLVSPGEYVKPNPNPNPSP
jgi:hypothetical protein